MFKKPALTLFLALSVLLTGCSQRTANGGASPVPFGSDKQVKIEEFPLPSRSPSPTPTHVTLSPTPFSPVPSPTPCTQTKLAVNLLLDTSSSMKQEIDYNATYQSGAIMYMTNNRLSDLKTAVIDFSQQLKDTDIIGVQEFNGFPFNPGDSQTGNSTNVVHNFSTWANSKATFASKINGLRAIGSTHTRDGFSLALQQITQAQTQFPGYKWIMIFISDGIPKETYIGYNQSLNIFYNTSPDLNQDPRQHPSLVDQIKAKNVDIFSIGLALDQLQPASNVTFGKQLIKDVASKPQNAFENVTEAQLQGIYNSIAQNICR